MYLFEKKRAWPECRNILITLLRQIFSHPCLAGFRGDGEMLNRKSPIENDMIILKLNIKPVNLSDDFELRGLRIEKRVFLGEVNQKYLQLIKDVQKYCYNENNNNIKIESIIGECPTFLDDKDNLGQTTPIKKNKLKNYVGELKDEIDRLKNEGNQDLDSWNDELDAWTRYLEDLLDQYSDCDTILIENKYTRCGYYTRDGKSHNPDGKSHNPEIVLLMETIGNDEKRLISTYVHEMFHAYYDLDWINDKKNPTFAKSDLRYYLYIEEPLTEYAMLKFLEAFGYEGVHEVAKSVRKKQLSPGICHYGFGYYLWKWEKDGNKPLCDWINCYKEAKFKISDEDKKKFALKVKGLYPFGKECDCMKLLCEILTGAKCEHQCSGDSTGGSIKNKRKKERLSGWYL